MNPAFFARLKYFLLRERSFENPVAILPEEEVETPVALLNDVILQNIFKYLTYKDLKSIRDVKNTIWLRNSKKAWWSRTKVTLTKEKVEEYFNQTEVNARAKNYKLISFDPENCHRFLERFAHFIKYLNLINFKFDSVDQFRQIIYTACPNLEKLEVHGVTICTTEVVAEPMKCQEPQFGEQKNLKFLRLALLSKSMPLSWMEALSHFPNLEVLQAHTDVNIYKVISIIRQHDPKKLKLKRINIVNPKDTTYPVSFRRFFLDPDLPLERIHFEIGWCQPDFIVEAMDLHAKSLKELSLPCNCAINRFRTLPHQPLLNLETLTLRGCRFTEDILRFTPNLRKFRLFYDGTYNLVESADTTLRINACREVHLNIRGNQWRDKEGLNSDLRFFMNVFPNVEILRISGLDNVQFSMICERWTKLVFLEAFDSVVDVCGLLGFDPDPNCEDTARQTPFTSLEDLQDFGKRVLARNPNITNLKDLRVFAMTAIERSKGAPKEAMRYGDVVRRELRKLPLLKKFKLMNYQLEEPKHWRRIFRKYRRN